MSTPNAFWLGTIIGVILAALAFSFNLPTTYMIAFTEDNAHLVNQYRTRGDCLVELELQPPQNFKLQCWSKPNDTTSTTN